jgi:hypothetical protein
LPIDQKGQSAKVNESFSHILENAAIFPLKIRSKKAQAVFYFLPEMPNHKEDENRNTVNGLF